MPTPTATAGISPREAEVLTLVGEHRSNAEIGAQLFISVRTVETHVSSLLRKLGAPDRRALADAAVHPDAGDHLATAHPMVAGNPIATAVVERAAALAGGDPERLPTIAAAFATAGCPYQQARTLILAGPDTTAAGHAVLADLGLSP